MFVALAEQAASSVLATDPETIEALAELDGRSIAFRFKGLDISLVLYPVKSGLELEINPDTESDVIFTASPLIFVKLAQQGMEQADYAPGELTVNGDALLGKKFAQILNQVEIDWEEVLATKLGDVPAHLIGRQLRALFAWVAECQTDGEHRLRQLMHKDENPLAASKPEVQEYISGVDRLMSDLQRLESRINRLEAL